VRNGRSWPNESYYPNICLEEWRSTLSGYSCVWPEVRSGQVPDKSERRYRFNQLVGNISVLCLACLFLGEVGCFAPLSEPTLYSVGLACCIITHRKLLVSNALLYY
jgi:hypothetical protein